MSDPDVSDLLAVRQAIRILDSISVTPRMIPVPLAEADGLCLAQPILTDRDYPPFDKSQMDGYAVRRADVSTIPAELRVVGELAAGQVPGRAVEPGEAIAIMTGAPMPPGAEGVVPVEDVEKVGESMIRVVRAGGDPGRFIARRGSDCAAGQVVLRQGTRLGPAQIAVTASVGASEVDVYARPQAAVLATGDELVSADREPGPAQIRNSNTPMLLSLLRKMGCDVTDLGVAPDRPDAIRAALERGLAYDTLFVTGGMSMGEYDYIPQMLKELGVDLKITKLRIKPGKPFVFGVKETESSASVLAGGGSSGDGAKDPGLPPAASKENPIARSRFVFGLPGNPVSGFVCTVRLASRLLSRLGGGTPDERWLSGKLDCGLPSNGPREFYQPAIRAIAAGRDSSHAELATITPLKWKGSADLFTLAQANVLLVRPENDPTLPKGTVVRVLEV
jgi:molybdopterin molybdotransferase